MTRSLIAIAVLALAGCTTIDRVNVLTVAVDCNVTRGDDKSAGGEAQGNALQQSGAAGAKFVGSLRSVVTCRDGTTIEAEVEGGAEDAAAQQ